MRSKSELIGKGIKTIHIRNRNNDRLLINCVRKRGLTLDSLIGSTKCVRLISHNVDCRIDLDFIAQRGLTESWVTSS